MHKRLRVLKCFVGVLVLVILCENLAAKVASYSGKIIIYKRGALKKNFLFSEIFININKNGPGRLYKGPLWCSEEFKILRFKFIPGLY